MRFLRTSSFFQSIGFPPALASRSAGLVPLDRVDERLMMLALGDFDDFTGIRS
jgi:hypothetical protein